MQTIHFKKLSIYNNIVDNSQKKKEKKKTLSSTMLQVAFSKVEGFFLSYNFTELS